MISPIYRVSKRGQVVTDACQWIGENLKLALRIIVIPMAIAGLLLALNILFFDSWFVYMLCALFAILVLPIQTNLMFHVVENPEEFDYPDKMPRLVPLMRYWWHYYWPFLKIYVLGTIILWISAFTVVGPILMSFSIPLAIVMCQRDEDAGLNSLVTSVKLIFSSFGNFLLCAIGSFIIILSLIGAPCLVVYGIGGFIHMFISRQTFATINKVLDNDIYSFVANSLMIFGAVLSVQIIIIIIHFFYGLCIEETEHPALIDRMEKFDDCK